MTSRSITMTLTNRTPFTLVRYEASATQGGLPAPAGVKLDDAGKAAISLAPGMSIVVTAKNSNGSCIGKCAFTDKDGANVRITATYHHPGDNGSTQMGWTLDKGYPGGQCWPDKDVYSGDDVAAAADLYDGAAVILPDAAGNQVCYGYTPPLAADPYSQDRNCQDYVNAMFVEPTSLFPTPPRQADFSPMFDQGKIVPYMPVDFTGGNLAIDNDSARVSTLVGIIQALWPGVSGTPNIHSPDYGIVKCLADFLVPEDKKHPYFMHVPKFGFLENTAEGPKYQLTGYETYPFLGSSDRFKMSTVRIFLQLLLSGAHFVNIQADSDFKNQNPKNPPKNTSRDLYNTFTATFKDGKDRHSCLGNSHYASKLFTDLVNTTGWYYGNSFGEWAAPDCGLLVALLVAQTATGEWNTFMQLEGWPADNDWWMSGGGVKGGRRHGKDFDRYQDSLWNISTFGASPYSEKRATTIFLSTAEWTPAIHAGTFMMPYVGAETAQHWLNKTVVSVPSGTK